MSRVSSPPAFELSRSVASSVLARLHSRTDAELRFDDGSRALYATDASNYRQVPLGVVIPRHMDEVREIVAACREFDLPVLPRGGGTSLAGQCCNVAVVIDTSKYCNRILELDPLRREATVETGCVLDNLRNAAETHHLTFGPDPSTHNHNTLGGMIGNNSCGVHSVMAGRTADNVLALQILTYDGVETWVGPVSAAELAGTIAAGGRKGEIYAGIARLRDRYGDLIRERYPDIPRRVSGYNLPQLLEENGTNVARALVGSEGTCAFVLRARLRLTPSPRARSLVVIGFRDVYEAADAVPRILEHGPIGLEGMDEHLVQSMRTKRLHSDDLELLPEGGGWLLVEFGSEEVPEAHEKVRNLLSALSHANPRPVDSRALVDPAEAAKVWEIRESGLGATARVPGEDDTYPGWEDSAVAPERLGEYLRRFRALLERYGYHAAMYGHFGDGCLHTRIDSQLRTTDGLRQWQHFAEEAADLVVACGGSLSGEHGDGQARGELLERMYGAELMSGMREFKRLWDPSWKMNPGKIVNALPIDARVRAGPTVVRTQLQTVFAYPQDAGDFTRATLRCVGVGECRREAGAVMCPSYQATREEMHSTRGRAHLLYEMLRGMSNDDGPLDRGWRDPAVHESLDLCLACKGCRRECPVNVDMATYKGEFMHAYYAHRMRPRTAYSMGLIHWWSRIGSHLPWLVNLAGSAPGLGALMKVIAGVARERALPQFADWPFTLAVNRGELSPPGKADVLLWPDTFSNFFRPQALHAAFDLLRSMGLRVALPGKIACCARPLYAEGMLDTARSQLRRLLHVLNEPIAKRLPLVGLEPSCVASFGDELPNLFPDDDRALYLRENSLLLDEFLRQADFHPPRLGGRALVHLHCNHRAVMEPAAELALLDQLFEEYRIPEPGCCGMAGPFGFDAQKFDVSMRIAQRALLPAVREASVDTVIVADGFSCREQIQQSCGREVLHLAEVLHRAQQA